MTEHELASLWRGVLADLSEPDLVWQLLALAACLLLAKMGERVLRGRQVGRSVDAHLAAVGGHQGVVVARHLHDGAVEQDSSVLGHQGVQPSAGRSNHRCTCAVPIEFSYSPYWRAGAVTADSPRAPIISR